MSTTPTARTLKYLREGLGMTAEVVERFNSFTKTRKDLYGFVDIVAVAEDRGIWFVQATSTDNMAARVHKIRDRLVHGSR